MPFRIFSGAEIGNPNKAMLFRVGNVNGYEALWQASALRYFAWTQGIASVSTTGLREVSLEKNSGMLHAAKYYVSETPPAAKWPLKMQVHSLKVYENPSPLPIEWPVFSHRAIGSYGELLRVLDSSAFDPRKTLLTISALDPENRPSRA